MATISNWTQPLMCQACVVLSHFSFYPLCQHINAMIHQRKIDLSELYKLAYPLLKPQNFIISLNKLLLTSGQNSKKLAQHMPFLALDVPPKITNRIKWSVIREARMNCWKPFDQIGKLITPNISASSVRTILHEAGLHWRKAHKVFISQNLKRMLGRGGPRIIRNGGR